MNIDRLAQYYRDPAEMANHPLSELEELVQEYPFFTAGQLLLLKQYRIHNSSRYKKQHRKMLALAPDPVRAFLFTEGEAWIRPEWQEDHVESGDVESGHVETGHVETGHVESVNLESGHAAGENLLDFAWQAGPVEAADLRVEPLHKDESADAPKSDEASQEVNARLEESDASDFLSKPHDIQDWFRYYASAMQSSRSHESSAPNDKEYERELLLAASADLLNAPPGPLMPMGMEALRVKLGEDTGEPLSADSMHTIRILAQASINDGQLPASETLAEVFASQQEWDHAIAIYEQLILMNPEKIPIFAARIAQLKQAKS